ncbi:MAG: hypothetical protein FJX76_10295 [Armatimonadetes bacterium]|nr:hypothetical protein [Armatimonadota bacterium]
MRSDLAAAVAALDVKPGELVHAVLVCQDRRAFDVENLLFYNLGQGAFTRIADHGMRFERLDAPPPPCPVPLETDAPYLHLYLPAAVTSGYLHWRSAGSLASWRNAACGSRVADLSLASVWSAIKRSGVTAQRDVPSSGPLAIRLVLAGSAPCRLASCLKGLVDGALSALHSHDGSSIDVIAPRLAARLGLSVPSAKELLADRSADVLGRIRLVTPWGASLQWLPRDDLLVAGELVRVHAGSSGWLLSGEVTRVEENEDTRGLIHS